MRARSILVTILATILASSPRAIAGETLDVRAWLDRPGVKLLAVEFYATWCKPCMEAVPRWKALHEKYAAQGLRLVVVATQDPKGGCVNPGWNPDDVICDYEGFIARSFGANESLPAAFLWSWQGRLLVRQGHVEHVDEAIQKWMREAPRVDIEISVERDSGVDRATLEALVRAKLDDYDKLIVIASKEERAKLEKLKRDSFKSRFDDALQCEVGKELSANSLLQAQVLGKAGRQRLQLSLFSAERGCLVASAIVDWNPAKPNVSTSEAVGELVQKLRTELEMPTTGKSEIAFGGGAAVEIRVPQISVSAVGGGLGNINLKVEQLLDHAKGAEENKTASPESKASAWCALADVSEKNPYQDTAKEACRSWRTYARTYRKQSASLDEDYHTLAGYLSLQRTSREQRIAAADAFLAAYKGASDDLRVKKVGEARSQLSAGRNDVRIPDMTAEHQAACDSGDAGRCTLLANMAAKGIWPASQDLARAADLYAKGCNGGDASACVNLGGMYAEGRGVSKDLDRAVAMFSTGCEAGEAVACLGLANALAATGDGAKIGRAADAFKTACELGESTACTRAAKIYRDRSDEARAVDVDRRGCELGDQSACFSAARAYDEGRAVARDQTRALPLYKKACEAGTAPACRRLAEMTQKGEGVEKDPARAALLFERSCQAGEAIACESLAELYLDGRGVAKDEARGAKLLEKSCDGGVRAACPRLAHLIGDGGSVPQDRAHAAAIFDKACKEGDADSCTSLGAYYALGGAVTKAPDRALALFQLGCDRGDANGCTRATEMKARDAALTTARVEREERRTSAASWRSTGWWLIVPGIVAGTGAGAFALLGNKTNDDVLSGGFATSEDIGSAADRGQAFNVVGTALAVVGAAAITVGLPMILLNIDPGPMDESEPAP